MKNSVVASSITQRSYPKTTFDTVLILTDKATFPDAFRTYQESTGFLEDDTVSNDALQQAGLIAFMQEPKARTVIVAKVSADYTTADILMEDLVALDSTQITDFFMVTLLSDHTDDQKIELAKYVETQEFMCSLHDDSVDAIDGMKTTDLSSRLKALGLRKTFVNWHNAQRLDIAFSSRFVGEDIGLVSAKHLVLSGVTASNLSNTEATVLEGKNCNYYDTERKKFTFTKQGVTSSGEPIKSIAGEIFIAVSTIEKLYEIQLNNSNISFNDDDLRKIKSGVNFEIRKAQRQEIIAKDAEDGTPSFLVEYITDRANQKLEIVIKYLEAGTIKWIELKFVAFKDDAQFEVERVNAQESN